MSRREQTAKEIAERALDRHFAGAYGIFAGEPKFTAVLRFTPQRARWVAEEEWHPRQEGKMLDDGCYELRVPYADPRELIGDILRHGPEVVVIGPPALREEVARRLEATLKQYSA